jgi:hypothetical protein
MASGGGDSGLVELAAVSPLSQFHAGGARGRGVDAVPRASKRARDQSGRPTGDGRPAP